MHNDSNIYQNDGGSDDCLMYSKSTCMSSHMNEDSCFFTSSIHTQF